MARQDLKSQLSQSNLACALQLIHEEENPDGKPVGIMDCDIYGPSVPLMMGISGQPEVEENTIHPLCNYGVKVMSMGFLVDEITLSFGEVRSHEDHSAVCRKRQMGSSFHLNS